MLGRIMSRGFKVVKVQVASGEWQAVYFGLGKATSREVICIKLGKVAKSGMWNTGLGV